MLFKKINSELCAVFKNETDVYGYFKENLVSDNTPSWYGRCRNHVFWGKINGAKMFYTYDMENYKMHRKFYSNLYKRRKKYTRLDLNEVSRGFKLRLKKDYEQHLLMQHLRGK